MTNNITSVQIIQISRKSFDLYSIYIICHLSVCVAFHLPVPLVAWIDMLPNVLVPINQRTKAWKLPFIIKKLTFWSIRVGTEYVTIKCMPHFISSYTVFKMVQTVNRCYKQRKGWTISKEDKYVLSISKLMTFISIGLFELFPPYFYICFKII